MQGSQGIGGQPAESNVAVCNSQAACTSFAYGKSGKRSLSSTSDLAQCVKTAACIAKNWGSTGRV